MQELDISRCKSIDASTVAKAIAENKTLSKLVFGGNTASNSHLHGNTAIKALAPPATLELAMAQANFSNKNLGSGGATIITAWLTHKDNGALTSLNLLSNRIPVEQVQELVEIMQAKENLTTLCGLSGMETELDLSDQALGMGCGVLVANEIINNAALTKFDISKNSIRAEGGKALAEALKGNQVIIELNMSSNHLGLNIGFGSDMSGVTALADVIPGMGAISLVNLLHNGIGTDQAKDFVDILKNHPTLKSLCGNKGNETELDMIGKMHGAGDAIMLVPDIIDNGVISKFTFSGEGYGNKPVTMETSMTEADFSGSGLGVSGAIMLSAFLPK
jgi:hypothetical protein